ncbi:hypothetical protein N866_09630 [Actinotalea ferrariae CF5-4]|uniref:Thioredoxin domain-containing protein n=1 Tax=Actinotalea ferrariae CF5-4 TaxID=948458 RepID=A0A021VQI6_9CELL|nr:hypothetical protein [Actinotalea ferrariae]EYR62325.1 hypothetical protein N866_09630 [Actinotalea ferrariae CF5-4]
MAVRAGRSPRAGALSSAPALVVTLLLGVLLLLLPPSAPAAGATDGAQAGPEAVELVRFTGEGCPKCAEQSAWLAEQAPRFPGLVVVEHEVWADAQGRALFVRTGEELGFEASSVPTTVLGERVWIGWTDAIAEDLAAALDRAVAGRSVQPGVYGTPGAGTCSQEALACESGAGAVVDVPLLGEVDLGARSLLVSTLVIGFVDGVNPCSLWAISVLLTIVVRTASRRRVVAVGGTFLLVTAGMYALYMAGIYSALSVATHLAAVQAVVAVVAGVVGVVSVKDYVAFKRGISFTIPDAAKPGLYKRMRAAAGQDRLGPALLATAALGVAVSLLETPCTAGFPVLWTGLLQQAGVPAGEAAALFGAYMVPFLLDEIVVVAVAVGTMRALRLQEHHGQVLKLFAGITMLALAGVIVVAPDIMEKPLQALAVFAAASVLTGLVHVVATAVRRRRAVAPEATPVG